MLFTSLEFVCAFLPVVYGLYYVMPKRIKNYWLLLASLLFYAWGEPKFVFVMIISICVNYFLALQIEKRKKKEKKARQTLLIVCLIFNLGILLAFKYTNFITSSINSLFPNSPVLPNTQIALPIGISFFTFQTLSYVIDVYRKTVPAQRKLSDLALYISLFPQLVAGPIVRYSTIIDQLSNRPVNLEKVSTGLLRFMIGFNKKMLLANVLGELADHAFAANGAGSISMAWLGALCYALQILFDFSGYSDMAIGLGSMLGFTFPENFNMPYISKTITEFWRRWHISLGAWFRDYVYFPLGGSRVKKSKLVRNLFVVWLLTGLWHGANWTFILWGLLYGIIIIIEKTNKLPEKLESSGNIKKGIYQIFTLLFVLFGWVLFRSDTISSAFNYLKTMLGINGTQLIGNDFVFYGRDYIVYIIAGIILCTPLLSNITTKLNNSGKFKPIVFEVVSYTTQIVLFIISLSMLFMNVNNPFIYFNF